MSFSTTNSLSKTLQEFGLSDKETRVYLALLEFETSAIQEIAKYAGVNRSSTYVVLESLLRKGLVSTSEGGKKYLVSPPDTLLRQAEHASQKSKEIQERIREILPTLKAWHRENRHRPRVQVFEGKEGMKLVYEDALSSKKGSLIRAFSQPKAWEGLEEGYFSYLKNKRIAQGIHLKAIYPYEIQTRGDFTSIDKKRLAEFRFLPRGVAKFSSDFRIYEDKIALTSYEDRFGIVIENKEITDMIKFLFDLAWEKADKAQARKKQVLTKSRKTL